MGNIPLWYAIREIILGLCHIFYKILGTPHSHPKQGVVSIQVELGRHLGKECLLCDDECEIVCHVLREFLVYSSLRNDCH